MMKYQFCIRFTNIDAQSAASKAVADCNSIFLNNGYRDYTFTVGDNANKFNYYRLLAKELFLFYKAIKNGSIVVLQYPLLSINTVFKYFIKLARLKNIRFYCVVHDLESLRSGGNDAAYVKNELENLNFLDFVIAHNPAMIDWLLAHGLTAPVVPLGIFDYLCKAPAVQKAAKFGKTIVFAGNLSKSTFIYSLDKVSTWKFNVYGPNYLHRENSYPQNMTWRGQYGPEEVVQQLEGDFGLIWDGSDPERYDDALGNYLRYNNPHKFSLYIAAGLPVIAPAASAIGVFIKEHNIGVLIHSLTDLDKIVVSGDLYELMKANISKIQDRVVRGAYLTDAISLVEEGLKN